MDTERKKNCDGFDQNEKVQSQKHHQIALIRKMLNNITDDIIVDTLKKYPNLSDQLLKLFNLRLHKSIKRNCEDDICVIEKKRTITETQCKSHGSTIVIDDGGDVHDVISTVKMMKESGDVSSEKAGELTSGKENVQSSARSDCDIVPDRKHHSKETSSQNSTIVVEDDSDTISDVSQIDLSSSSSLEFFDTTDDTVAQENASSQNNKYCVEIFQRLQSIFPNIDNNYLRKFCPETWLEDVDRDVQIGRIVEELLKHEKEWKMASAPEQLVTETLQRLHSFLPDADWTYLRAIAEEMYDNQEHLERFVEDKVQLNDYPKQLP